VNPEWLTALIALITIVAAIVAWVARKTWYIFRRTNRFLEDWNGQPSDTSHEGHPGVMARLLVLEHSMTDIQGQVHLNSGHSMRDEVQRIEAAVEALDGKVGRMADTQAGIRQTVDELKARP
jgi:hypothetical protein